MTLNINNFVIRELLGEGTSSVIYKSIYNTPPRSKSKIPKIVALKLTNDREIKLAKAENEVYSKIKHKYILEYYGTFTHGCTIYLVLEYIDGENMFEYLSKNGTFDENLLTKYMKMLLDVLVYLHKINIIHCDIKPENILLTHNDIRLCDFGFAIQTENKQTNSKGTPLYVAPEIISQKLYDNKVDMWAIGVLIFECLVGKTPYTATTPDDLYQKLLNDPVEYPESISNQYKILLQSLLEKDPNKRFTAKKSLDMILKWK